MKQPKIRTEAMPQTRVCWNCSKPIAIDSNYQFCGTMCKIKWEDKQPLANRKVCLNCREEFFESNLTTNLCSRNCKMEYYKATMTW
jgi:hypothetical protein